MRASPVTLFLLTACALLACSSESTNSSNAGSGGASGSGASSGASGAGGSSATGGSTATGGSGGSTATGGASGTAGSAGAASGGSAGSCAGTKVTNESCKQGSGFTCCNTNALSTYVTWDAARASCQEKCLDLVVVKADADTDAMANLLASEQHPNTWIGLRKDASNQFKWVDGSPLTYENWQNNEPSNDPTQRCAYANTALAKHPWSDTDCGGAKIALGTVRGWCCR